MSLYTLLQSMMMPMVSGPEFPDLEYTSSTGSTLTELITNAQRLWNSIY